MTLVETGEMIVPTDTSLRAQAEAVAECLLARGQTMVTAESCTGGWVAKTLTDIAGSSAWFECGVVAYSYEAKESLLGVQPHTLERHGAVSQETAVEMVSGALARYGASVAVAVLWRELFAGDGLVNRLLALVGIVGPSWISNPRYSLWTLILLSVWQFGSPMIIFLAGLRQIPRDVYEAAAIDGAGRTRLFWSITLPLLTPVVFFNAVIQTIDAFKSFTPAFIISGGTGNPINSTLFYTLYLYQEAFGFFRMGYASALAWILLIIIAVFTGISFLSSRYWVHYDE